MQTGNDKTDEDGQFERAISHYLEARIYERRGMSRADYIAECRRLWDECKIDEDFEYKTLVDTYMTLGEKLDRSRLDYKDSLLYGTPVYEEERGKSLYCIGVSLMSAHGTRLRKDGVEVDFEGNVVNRSDSRGDPVGKDPDELKPMPYIIALFDILGFSNKLKGLGIEKLLVQYQELIDKAVLYDSWSSLGRLPISDGYYASALLMGVPIRYSYFSDTILLWIPLVQYLVSPFIARCAKLICEAIKIGLPLRGGLTIGPAVMNKDKSTYLGSPIVEAYRVEKAQNWIGLSFGPSATWPPFHKEIDYKLVIPGYTKHYKRGFRSLKSRIVLDWPRRWREDYPEEDLGAVISGLNSERKFRRYYKNTINFVIYSSDNANWNER